MRPIQWVGLLLIIAGVAVLWKRPSYSAKRNVVEIGEFKATMNEERAIPPWIGAAGVAGGVLLLLAGRRGGHA